jgi:protein-S-isoprenylcysteine O-methyltransferase Ste14
MLLRLCLQLAAWLLTMGLVLFLAAGDPSWLAAWAFLILMGGLGLAVGLWLAWRDPGLLHERLAPPWCRGPVEGDRWLMGALFLGFYFWLALMGLDSQRWGTSTLPDSLQGVGVLAIVACFWITWLTFRANGFAAIALKVQPGQTVVESGPYARVRHPMYAAAIGFFLGVPLMLGSWMGLAVAPVFIAAIAWRALGEERMLRASLPGYAEYAGRVRYRLIPRVW